MYKFFSLTDDLVLWSNKRLLSLYMLFVIYHLLFIIYYLLFVICYFLIVYYFYFRSPIEFIKKAPVEIDGDIMVTPEMAKAYAALNAAKAEIQKIESEKDRYFEYLFI